MKKNKKLSILLISLIALMLLLPTVVNAGGLKAEKPNGSTIKSLVSQKAEDFFTLIKGMKSLTGTLGVASDASKIDCHMAKNTEWGTAAMLGVSKYGQASTGNNSKSTTNNNTGVFQMADGTYEYVAGIYEGKIPTGLDAKYFNVYSGSTGISGDALTATTGYVSGYGSVRWVSSSFPWFLRSNNALLGTDDFNGNAGSNYGSRAVVVCGSGLLQIFLGGEKFKDFFDKMCKQKRCNPFLKWRNNVT